MITRITLAVYFFTHQEPVYGWIFVVAAILYFLIAFVKALYQALKEL